MTPKIYWRGHTSPRARWRWWHMFSWRVRALVLLGCIITLAQIALLWNFWGKFGRVEVDPVELGAGRVDYIGLVLKPSCVTRESILNLAAHQQPRQVWVVTPELKQCRRFLEPLGTKVGCLDEAQLLPGVNKESIRGALLKRFPDLQTDISKKGRTPAGWYLQQILKLGVLEALPEISDPYVIWDFDMLPVRPMPLMVLPHRESVQPGFRDMRELPTVVRIGGARAHGYEASYLSLFGRRLELASDGSSFVTHWVVVRKHLMAAFLRALRPADGKLSWVDNVIESIPETDQFQGFSEYASYVSWVKQNYPDSQAVAVKKTWMRQPLGGDWAVRLAALLHPSGLCCPSHLLHKVQRWYGFEYYGFEIGHHKFCAWEKHNHVYGLV